MEFDFAANTTVDDPQLVPEAFRAIYVEKDGAHSIAENYLPLANLASGLQKSLKAAREDAKKAKTSTVDLSALAEFGATPAEIAEAVKTQIGTLNDQLSKGLKLDPEKIKAEVAATFTTQIKQRDDQLVAMNSTLSKHLVTAEAIRAIAIEKGVPELLMPHINSQAKVVRNGDEYSVAVVDKDGDARISGITGQPMTLHDLVKEMKSNAVFGRAFESEAASGGGARQSNQNTRTPASQGAAAGQLTPLQMIEAGLNAGNARRQ